MVLHIGSTVGRESPTSLAAMDMNHAGEHGEVKMILRRYGVTKSPTGRSTVLQGRVKGKHTRS